jgi:hypothetical protein
VVSSVLASTAPVARGRAAKQAVRAARPVELEIPGAIALVDGDGVDPSAASLGSAHLYRPSKLYHIYGGSVNPVARKKLEKRLRRTHTIHTMRRSARAVVKQPDARPRTERLMEVDELVAEDPAKPRSLERTAIASSMHYDALEHLENAAVAPPAAHPPRRTKTKKEAADAGFETDELGGLIAHLGEGGEAVVDTTAVKDLDFTDGPVFDRRGRQRARIAPDEREEVDAKAKVPPPKPEATAPPKRHEDAAREKARVDRWLERTLADMPDAPTKRKASAPVQEPAPPVHPAAAGGSPEPATEQQEVPSGVPRKQREKPRHAPAGGFEVTHGSVEADAEAETDDGEDGPSQGGKRNRTAAQILKEIRQERKDDAARKQQADVAKRARDAKAAADEIERRIRHNEDASAVGADGEVRPGLDEARGAVDPADGSTVPAAGGQAVALQARPKPRRHRSDDLEAVLTTNEELSGDLELTLDPVRAEDASAREAHAAVAKLPMIDPEERAAKLEPEAGDGPPHTAPEEIGGTAGPGAAAAAQPVPEGEEAARDVGPGDVVLAGPSTDTPGYDPEEAELSDNDRDKIRKRLQEGWNRL